VGRRERTRKALLRAATELVAEQGYDATTTASIARRAGVTEVTLFRHFPTKASLFVDDPYDPVIAGAVRDRPVAEPALTAAVRGVRDAWSSLPEPAAAEVRERLRLVARTPALVGALAEGSRATEEALEGALVGRGTGRAEARVVAAALVAALNRSLLDWSLDEHTPLDAALETVFGSFGEPSCPA
jgi:AcrR family transcriptional regulator